MKSQCDLEEDIPYLVLMYGLAVSLSFADQRAEIARCAVLVVSYCRESVCDGLTSMTIVYPFVLRVPDLLDQLHDVSMTEGLQDSPFYQLGLTRKTQYDSHFRYDLLSVLVCHLGVVQLFERKLLPIVHPLDLADHPEAAFADIGHELIFLELGNIRIPTRHGDGR